MAESKSKGAAARLNPQHEVPREGMAGQERAWLAGLAWLGGLTPAERDAALAAAATPAETPDANDAPSRAETLLDVAREIRAWGSVGLYGAADRLEALAQELPAARSAQPAVAADWAPDAERVQIALEAAWQVDELMRHVISALPNDTDMVAPLSMAARVRDLACAQMSALSDESEKASCLHRKVYGVYSSDAKRTAR